MTEKEQQDSNSVSVPADKPVSTNAALPRKFFPNAKQKGLRFIGAGVFLTVYAYGLNIILVELLRLEKGIAYALVLGTQMFLGLFINRYLVFERGASSLSRVSAYYFGVSILFRLANWVLYIWLNASVFPSLEKNYIYSQSICIVLFTVLKYFVFKRIFEGEKKEFLVR
jgi:putative flippase GtrA